MKTTDFITTYNENAEYDDEAGSVKNNLHTIIRVSTHLERAIGDDENMAEWCQEKIAQVKGMIVSVMDYIISQHEMGKKDELPGFNAAAADVQMSEMLDFGDSEPSPVTSAITRRIMMQRVDLLQKYGPELVGNAIDEVADFVGDVEEIGSSDVSGWVKHVERMLANNPPEAFAKEGVAEGTQTVGHEILGMLRQVKRQGHDAMEELYSSCPLLALFWDQYEGDFRSMVIELSPKTLNRIKAEIAAFNQQGVAEGSTGQWKVRSLAPDDSSWGVSRSVKTADGKFKSETHSKKFSSQEAAAAAAKKLNGTINEVNDDTGLEWFDMARWVVSQGDRFKDFTTNPKVYKAAERAYKQYKNQQASRDAFSGMFGGDAASLTKNLKIREDATGGATCSSVVGTVVKELGEEGMTRKQVNKKLGGYTNITTKPKAVKVKGAY